MSETTDPAQSNRTLRGVLADAEARYGDANPESRDQHARAAAHLPGGNTRTVLFYAPFPLTFARAEGASLWDLDGHSYVDYLGEFTAGLYGHSNAEIHAAVEAALAEGIVRGGPSRYEAQLAELVCTRFPSCEMVRFCNSGTEANLMAVGASRAVTGRSKIVVFRGGYHGGVLSFGHEDAPLNVPFPTLFADFNDLAGAVALIDREASEISTVLLEPMQGSAGAIPAAPGFLEGLREVTQAHGILLIFDEVMTSRLASGGLQQRLGVIPDLTSFGKYLGGGLSCGAFGGRADIMERFDPRRVDSFGHSGTFNNNVLTLAAGLTGLRDVFTPAAADALNRSGDDLRGRLNHLARGYDVPVRVTGLGSILCIHPGQRTDIQRPADLTASDDARALFHLHMIDRGFYLARRGFMSLSLPLKPADHDGFAIAFEAFLDEYADLL